MRYNPWGEVRYTWTTSLSTTPAYQLTRYTYTGQYSYMDDPTRWVEPVETTAGVTEGFGLMFYNARGYDPYLNRFAQADSIVPPGVQGLDRYAYVNNSPIIYTDPSGHFSPEQIEKHLRNRYKDKWEGYWNAWKSDKIFWGMLLNAQYKDTLVAPTTDLPLGTFSECGSTFCFDASGTGLEMFQGYGPYVLIRNNLPSYTSPGYEYSANQSEPIFGGTGWQQPIYDYSSGDPIFTNTMREVRFDPTGDWSPDFFGGTGLPWLATGAPGAALTIAKSIGVKMAAHVSPIVGPTLMVVGAVGYLSNNVLRFDAPLSVSIVPAVPNLNVPVPFDPFPRNIPGSP